MEFFSQQFLMSGMYPTLSKWPACAWNSQWFSQGLTTRTGRYPASSGELNSLYISPVAIAVTEEIFARNAAAVFLPFLLHRMPGARGTWKWPFSRPLYCHVSLFLRGGDTCRCCNEEEGLSLRMCKGRKSLKCLLYLRLSTSQGVFKKRRKPSNYI